MKKPTTAEELELDRRMRKIRIGKKEFGAMKKVVMFIRGTWKERTPETIKKQPKNPAERQSARRRRERESGRRGRLFYLGDDEFHGIKEIVQFLRETPTDQTTSVTLSRHPSGEEHVSRDETR